MQTFIHTDTMFLQQIFEIKQPFVADVWFAFFCIFFPSSLQHKPSELEVETMRACWFGKEHEA